MNLAIMEIKTEDTQALKITLIDPHQHTPKFQIFSADCLCSNRFSMMCTAEVSINIRNAF